MSDEIIERSSAFTLQQRADEGDGLTLEGYAAVFNTPTRIDSVREGVFDEVIAPGAFKRTIAAKTPVLMFDHGNHPLYGSMPIGAIQELREDATGLYVKARLFDTWLNEPLRQAIDGQAVDGMSFRFSVPEGKDHRQKRAGDVDLRTVREVKLYELGPVVFPAYDATTVALRSLQAILPEGDTDTDPLVWAASLPAPTARLSHPGTSDEPAAERGTSDEPAASDDPAPTPLVPSTRDSRQKRLRQIEMLRKGIGKAK